MTSATLRPLTVLTLVLAVSLLLTGCNAPPRYYGGQSSGDSMMNFGAGMMGAGRSGTA